MISRTLASVETAALFVALYVGLPSIGLVLDVSLRSPVIPAWVRIGGIAPIALGSAGLAWSFAVLARDGSGTPNPWRPPRRLVTGGPYRWTRNPITASHAVALIVEGLLLGSPATIALVFVLALPVAVVMRIEERRLEARFGDAYRSYRSRVPRWFPGSHRPHK